MRRPAKPKRPEGALLSVVLRRAWVGAAVLLTLSTAIVGLALLTNSYTDEGGAFGLGLILASPLAALVPLTIAHGLKRADEIAELLRKIAARDAG